MPAARPRAGRSAAGSLLRIAGPGGRPAPAARPAAAPAGPPRRRRCCTASSRRDAQLVRRQPRAGSAASSSRTAWRAAGCSRRAGRAGAGCARRATRSATTSAPTSRARSCRATTGPSLASASSPTTRHGRAGDGRGRQRPAAADLRRPALRRDRAPRAVGDPRRGLRPDRADGDRRRSRPAGVLRADARRDRPDAHARPRAPPRSSPAARARRGRRARRRPRRRRQPARGSSSSARRRGCPSGPAVLALETGAPAWLWPSRRIGWGEYRARLERIDAARRGHAPRAAGRLPGRRGAGLRAARRRAPEQWWTLFFPIWDGPHGDRRPRPWAAPTCTSTASPRTACRASAEILEHGRGAPASTSSPSPTTSASTPRVAARAMAASARLPLEVIVGEEVTTRGGHVVGLFLSERIRPWQSLRSTRRRRSTNRAAWRSSPIRWCPTRCAPAAASIRRLLDDADAAVPPRRHRGLQPDHRAACAGAVACPASPTRSGWPRVGQQRRPPGDDIGRAFTTLRGHDRRRPAAAIVARDTDWEGEPTPGAAQVGDVRRQRKIRAECATSRGKCAATAPVATSATPAAGAAASTTCGQPPSGREDRPRHAVHLPRCRAASTRTSRYLYENLVARGHDVRIISSTHGPQRSSEGDVIRLGYGFSVPTNGSIGHAHGLASLRASWSSEMLERERFDVLHFHEPFVPFLSLHAAARLDAASTSPRSTPTPAGARPTSSASACSAASRRRLHGRIAVSAAARHFIDRYFPGDYKVIPNGVDLRRLPGRARPSRAGATAPPTSCSSAASRAARALMYLLKAYRMLRKRGYDCRLLVVGARAPGARGAALHRHAPAERRRAARAASATRTRRALRHGRRLRLAGHRPGVVRHRAARGDGRRHAHRVQRHPRLQGRRPPRRAGPARAAARTSRRWPRRIATLLRRPGAARADGRSRAASAPSQFCWQNITAKVEDYYGFVIRRLAAQGPLPSTCTEHVLAETASSRRRRSRARRACPARSGRRRLGPGSPRIKHPDRALLGPL